MRPMDGMFTRGSARKVFFASLLLVFFAATSSFAEITLENAEGLSLVEQFELIVEDLKPLDAFGAVEKTGDALYDKYALAVEEYLEYILTTPGEQKDYAAVLPDSILAEWEDEFGDDPRYWELRYLCSWVNLDDELGRNEDIFPISFLFQAWERGVADSNTLLILYMELEGFGEEESYPPLTAIPQNRNTFLELEKPEGAKALSGKVLQAAKKLNPDEGWVYYFEALNESNQGYFESAVLSLEDGNNAIQANVPTPFPIQLCGEAAANKETLGSVMVTGAVLSLDLSYGCPRIGYEIKASAKKFMAEFPGVIDPETTHHWAQMINRYSQSRQWSNMDILLSISSQIQLLNRLKRDHENWYGTSAKPILDDCRLQWKKLRDERKAFSTIWDPAAIIFSDTANQGLFGINIIVYSMYRVDKIFAENVAAILARRHKVCMDFGVVE